MANQPLGDLIETAMDKFRLMVSADTVLGSPIRTEDGLTLTPLTRVSYGFAAGGGDKTADGNKPGIWGGSGAGVRIDPVGFLVIKDGGARVVCVQPPAFSTADRLLDMMPDLMDKIEGYADKYARKKELDRLKEVDRLKTAGEGHTKRC